MSKQKFHTWFAFSSQYRRVNELRPPTDAQKDFKEAAKWCNFNVGGSDGYLRRGALGAEERGHMLAEITGGDITVEKWSVEQVQEYYNHAIKNGFQIKGGVSDLNKISFWSAVMFLVVCAKHKLSIKFKIEL